jgi:arsenite methyltransferase
MFSNPEKNISQLGLQEGMKVADFGAGNGFYSKVASKRVGNTGKVYAIEVQKELVTRLESEIKHWGVSNVVPIWGDIEKIEGTKIASNTIDAVIISNVLFQAEDKLGLIDEAKRILKKGGQVLLIDWKEDSFLLGFDKSKVLLEKTAEDYFIKRGFKIAQKVDVSVDHYGIIFKYEG